MALIFLVILFLLTLLLALCCRRRKLAGTIEGRDGNPLEGIRVSLDGKEQLTDESGKYSFPMGRGTHSLCIRGGKGDAELFMDIRTDCRKEPGPFTVVRESGIRIRACRSGFRYRVDAVLAGHTGGTGSR